MLKAQKLIILFLFSALLSFINYTPFHAQVAAAPSFNLLPTAHASPVHPLTEAVMKEMLPAELPAIIASRWMDSSKTMSHQTWYREQDHLFEAYFSSHLRFRHSDMCEDVLQMSQNFALSRMLKSKYISAEQKTFLKKLAHRLKYSQFRFYEYVQPRNPSELGKVNLEDGDLSMVLVPMMTEDTVMKVEATLWSVAAQTTTSHVRISHERMPFQLDEGYSKIKVDREKYKLGWEIGRAAQDSAGLNDILVKAALVSMVNDAFAYGESLEDSYVFVHTLGPAQSRLFQSRKIPGTNESAFKVFHTADAEKHDEVLVARLSDLLEILPPNTFSKRLQGVMDVTNGALGWKAAAEHIFAMRDSLQQHVDNILPSLGGKKFPLILKNTTPVPGWFVAKVAEKYGILNTTGPLIAKYFNQVGWRDTYTDENILTDEITIPTSELVKQKMFTISNLDPEVAKQNPNYVKTVVMAAYLYYEKYLRASYPAQASELLSYTQFVVTTHNDSVVRQAERIPGARAVPFRFHNFKGELEMGPGSITFQPNVQFYGEPGYLYDAPDVVSLINSNPNLAREASRALRKGNWQLIHHLNEAIGF